jgi:restriction system protein
MEGDSAMINSTLPDDWRGLQDQVAQILKECGFEVETEKTIETVRGTVEIDVFAEDPSQKPSVVHLCECKHWQARGVPKSVVHTFRTVVSDFGANWGFVISSGGFQSGAYEAARHSNIRLLSWEEFQELYVDRWFQRYMVSRLLDEADPLVEYTEPYNSRIFRKADALSAERKGQFRDLRKEYAPLAFLGLRMYAGGAELSSRPQLPLCQTSTAQVLTGATIPAGILEAAALRDFLELYLRRVQEGVEAFDRVFGERA